MSTRVDEAGAVRQGWFEPSAGGLLTASWTLAGGMAGGLLIVAFILTDRMHPGGLVPIVASLALVGSLLGTVHGAVLAHLARPETRWTGRRRTHWVFTGLAGAAVVGIALLAALWLSLSAVVAHAGSPLGWLLLAAGLAVFAGCAAWATVLGWRALADAYVRWPEHRLGGWLVTGTFLVLVGTLMLLRPTLPGTGLALTPLGAFLVAAVATLWIALPAVVLMLPFTRGRPH